MSDYDHHVKTDYEVAEDLIAAIEGIFRIEDLKERCRKRRIARPRQLCFHLLRKHTDLSTVEIAEIFGLDHTTIMHGSEKIADDLNWTRFIPRILHVAGLSNLQEELKLWREA